MSAKVLAYTKKTSNAVNQSKALGIEDVVDGKKVSTK